jgi:hypothetical protein
MKIISNKKFLTPPPTSTDVERLFSTAGLPVDDKRAKLLTENLEHLPSFVIILYSSTLKLIGINSE